MSAEIIRPNFHAPKTASLNVSQHRRRGERFNPEARREEIIAMILRYHYMVKRITPEGRFLELGDSNGRLCLILPTIATSAEEAMHEEAEQLLLEADVEQRLLEERVKANNDYIVTLARENGIMKRRLKKLNQRTD